MTRRIGIRAASAAGADVNGLASKQLFRPATPYRKFVAANTGVKELTLGQGYLRFQTANGRQVAVAPW
jgi:hypothetical protein